MNNPAPGAVNPDPRRMGVPLRGGANKPSAPGGPFSNGPTRRMVGLNYWPFVAIGAFLVAFVGAYLYVAMSHNPARTTSTLSIVPATPAPEMIGNASATRPADNAVRIGHSGSLGPSTEIQQHPAQAAPGMSVPAGASQVGEQPSATTLPPNPQALSALASGPSSAASRSYAVGPLTPTQAVSPALPAAQQQQQRSVEVAFLGGDNAATTPGAIAPQPRITPPPEAYGAPAPSREVQDLAAAVSTHRVIAPITPYTLQAGAYVPAVLDGSVNSDFPGAPKAIVASDVFDSVSQQHLLIPAGSRLLGEYKTATVYGQNRIFVAWTRLFFPDGRWIALDGAPGVDQQGSSGLNASVNNHFGNLLGTALLLSALDAGVQLANPQATSANGAQTVGGTIASSIANSVTQLGTQIAQKQLQQVPTLQIQAGARFRIEVLKDLVFTSAYQSSHAPEANPEVRE